MRFLVDASMSPVVVQDLREAGHEAMHVGEVLQLNAPDDEILDYAAEDARIVVAADTDFGDLLASTQGSGPSVVLFHRQTGRRPTEQAAILLANLDEVEADLTTGAIVVIEERRVRVRMLPVSHSSDTSLS